MQSKSKSIVIASIMIMISISIPGCNAWPSPLTTHSPVNLSGVTQKWTRSNVFARQDRFSPMMVATEGEVCIYGGFSKFSSSKLSCLNESDSTISWQISDFRAVTALSAAPDGIYVGYSGSPEVDKHEIPSGNVIWSQSLSGRGLSYVFIVNDDVQVSTAPFIFTVLNKQDGKVIETRKGQDIYISTQQDTILPEIQAIDTNSGEMIWQQFDLGSDLRMAPIFLEDRIIARTGLTMGSVYAIDRATGDTLWKTEDNIVSSISYSPSKAKVYALTRDGKLLELDVSRKDWSICDQECTPPSLDGTSPEIPGREIITDPFPSIAGIIQKGIQ